MRTVPFFANTADDTHCFQACLKMVLKYFEPSKDFSWGELDEITNKPEGMWTWPMAGLSWLSENGYDVVDIEPFDYERFADEGKEYMQELWGNEVVAVQDENSDIQKAQNDSKQFVQLVNVIERIPTIDDMRFYLTNGYLLICNINVAKLNGTEEFIGHSVLVSGISQDGELLLNDPGLPAQSERKVTLDSFLSAWADPNEKAKNLMAINLKSKL